MAYPRRPAAPAILFLVSLTAVFPSVLVVDPQGGTTTPKLPTCKNIDFGFVYTECDEDNNRWRVAVPTKDCQGGAVPAPKLAPKCGKTCEPGEYLDIENTQDCVQCMSGQYSLGGGERFETWDKLPPGFDVSVEDEKYWDHEEANCTGSYWNPVGPFVASPGDYCSSKLTYSAELKKEGYLNFTYSMASSDTLFHVQVRNEQCETVEAHDSDKYPKATGDNKWDSIMIPLQAGHNIITWKAFGLSAYTEKRPARVFISKVVVMGLDFTSKCTACPPGTYTPSPGHSQCLPCDENTISAGGNSECKPCAETEYALRGSSQCTEKKPCSESDYYKHYDYSKCHQDPHETIVTYNWIEPTICMYGIQGAVGRPKNNKTACPNCNPGMELNSDDGSCKFCKPGQFSDGKDPCKKCPALTKPQEMMKFITWKEIPPVMKTICLSNENDDISCGAHKGWVPAGDHIHSGENYADNVYLILMLEAQFQMVEGGYYEGQASAVAELNFAFQLECHADCSLYFVEELENDDPQIIRTWLGATDTMQVYKHKIMTTTPRKFSWAFEKRDPEKEADPSIDLRHDVARIYNITVTNVANGGAVYCAPCPEGKDKQCVTCSDGMYYSNNTKKCIPCALNTYLSANKDECIPCGPGLKNIKEKVCYSDCKFTLDNHHYDLSPLKGFHQLDTSSSFTEQGNRYFKRYNISLCGTKGELDTVCTSNRRSYAADADETLNSLLCRSTILPSSKSSDEPISTQIMSIGDVLLGISHENTLHGMIDNITKPRADGQDLKDIRFFYHSPHITSGCPSGRSTIITLRCDPNAKANGSLSFIPECRDGTCDGCNFLVLWTTEFACPSCSDKDYMEIPGECKDGSQDLTYVWKENKICVGGKSLPNKGSQECVMPIWYEQMPWYAQYFIGAMVTFGLLMLVLIVCCWKRNRKLEYKYSKLIASANGELPAAETCALSEGEDEDDVVFQDGKNKGKAFFNKFRFKNGSGEKELLNASDSLSMQEGF